MINFTHSPPIDPAALEPWYQEALDLMWTACYFLVGLWSTIENVLTTF